MARKLTRAAALENRAFLRILRRTGNARLSAREVGVAYGTMQHRRRVHARFALLWDAALVFAAASLTSGRRRLETRLRPSTGSGSQPLLRMSGEGVGPRFRGDDEVGVGGGPSTIHSAVNGPCDARLSPGHAARLGPSCGEEFKKPFRTIGGEPVVVRLASGRLQMRRAQAGKLTRACEQAFLSALSATCNVTLSAAAAGASPRAFYRRKLKDPAFARELRMALQAGYDRIELALLQGGLAGSHEHCDWRSNDPPAVPPMSANQALQLMYLHQKEARLIAEPAHLKRRRGESRAAHSERLTAMEEERQRLAGEAFAVAEALRWERGEPAWGPAGKAVRAELGRTELGRADLTQVTGWSRANAGKVQDAGQAAQDAERALFGGWRIEDMEEALGEE